MAYDKTLGELRVEVSRDGVRQHDYSYGVRITYARGDGVEMNMCVEQMRDLRYLLDRAIACASDPSPPPSGSA